MDGQIGALPIKRVAEFHCLGPGPLHRKDHVPQRDAAGIRVLFLPDVPFIYAVHHIQQWKAEDIGGRGLVPVFPIDLGDVLVVGQRHIHRTAPVGRHFFQRRPAAAGHQFFRFAVAALLVSHEMDRQTAHVFLLPGRRLPAPPLGLHPHYTRSASKIQSPGTYLRHGAITRCAASVPFRAPPLGQAFFGTPSFRKNLLCPGR